MLALDTKAAASLAQFVTSNHYIPITSSTLNLHTIQIVLNDILINNRTNIVEFGTGISTFYISALITKHELPINFISFDHDKQWQDIIKRDLKKLGYQKSVELVTAPLKGNSASKNNLDWYQIDIIKNTIAPKQELVDLLLVDGPLAHNNDLSLSRYPALPIMHEYMAEHCSIILDDTHRKGEQSVIKLWEQMFPLNFQYINPVCSMATKGNHYNSV